MTDPVRKSRVFSGIQPSGLLPLGNYLGAIRQWLGTQADHENYFCIVDLHAVTIYQQPEMLRRKTLEVAAMYLAAGVDPRLSTIFVQSHVRAHAEGSWLLTCVTPVGWLERMTQYKAKAGQRTSVGAGLLVYPVLQAADIVLYDANEVPVGEDQKQHVELAQDIAQRFNHLYGETFVIPQAVIPASGARILALNDPGRKMSKSEAHQRGHAVCLTDDADEIRNAIQRAVTDLGREIVFSQQPEKAGVNNLLEIYELLTGRPRPEIEAHFEGRGYGEFKQEVAEVVIEALRPIRERYRELTGEPDELKRILEVGAENAAAIAEPKLAEMKQKMGFLASPRYRVK
ncbi:MAG: tryptophan--tRNA ligase [Chloroflexi bacterium RBG_16_57_11]|nr:MAG: tryptophan--tRNA ligase [Chloroflexi bacterium RBG_16_57_11]